MQVSELKEGAVFVFPWRPPGYHVGRVLRIGKGSAHVKQRKLLDGTWEDTYIALATEVELGTEEEFAEVFGGMMTKDGTKNRSTNESPVATVHRLCEENPEAPRKAIVEMAVKLGVNANTAKTQYYRWKRGY